MPRKPVTSPRCQVCQSPERHRIEHARVAGVSLDNIAAQFGVHRDAVWRHCHNHLSDDQRAQYLADVPVAELAKRATEEEIAILDYAKLVRSQLTQNFLLASQCHDHHAAAILAGRITELLNFIGKLTGEVRQVSAGSVTNNMMLLVNSPAFAQLEAMALRALAPFPEALKAFIGGLRELEAEASPPIPQIIDQSR